MHTELLQIHERMQVIPWVNLAIGKSHQTGYHKIGLTCPGYMIGAHKNNLIFLYKHFISTLDIYCGGLNNGKVLVQ